MSDNTGKRARRKANDLPKLKELENSYIDFIDYLDRIPEEDFHNAEIIKAYGKNVSDLRSKEGYTLEGLAEQIDIQFQALHQIEQGKRKKIDKNILKMLCGVFHMFPEELMGIAAPENRFPMEFYSELDAKKARFIIKRLSFEDSDLLTLLTRLSQEKMIRVRLRKMLSLLPVLKLLSEDQIKEAVGLSTKHNNGDTDFSNLIINKQDGTLCTNPDQSFEAFCKLAIGSSALLDIFVSIAASDRTVREAVFQILCLSGYNSISKTALPSK